MTKLFFSWWYRLNDWSHLAAAKALFERDSYARARHHIFTLVSDREELFGKDSPQSVQPLIWLGYIHLERVIRLNNVVLESDLSILQLVACSSLLAKVNRLIGEELAKARLVLRYAKTKIEQSDSLSCVHLELEMALANLSLCNSMIAKDAAREPCSSEYVGHLETAISIGEKLLFDESSHSFLLLMDSLIEHVLSEDFVSGQELISRAESLATKLEVERQKCADFLLQIEILHRPA